VQDEQGHKHQRKSRAWEQKEPTSDLEKTTRKESNRGERGCRAKASLASDYTHRGRTELGRPGGYLKVYVTGGACRSKAGQNGKCRGHNRAKGSPMAICTRLGD